MNQPIVFISGSKGGVGKSLTAMAVLDYLTTEHRYVRLLEADTTNPDVWKAYRRTVEGEVASLDEVEGWINLVNTCDANPFKAVVVNTPARNNDAVREHAAILLESLKELARPLITLWVINRQRDSLELLHNYMESVNTGVVHVIRNGYFGDQSKFELYRVTDELYSRRITLGEAAQQLKLGDRVELQRWRNHVREMMVQAGI